MTYLTDLDDEPTVLAVSLGEQDVFLTLDVLGTTVTAYTGHDTDDRWVLWVGTPQARADHSAPSVVEDVADYLDDLVARAG